MKTTSVKAWAASALHWQLLANTACGCAPCAATFRANLVPQAIAQMLWGAASRHSLRNQITHPQGDGASASTPLPRCAATSLRCSPPRRDCVVASDGQRKPEVGGQCVAQRQRRRETLKALDRVRMARLCACARMNIVKQC